MSAALRLLVRKDGQGLEPWRVKRADPIAGWVLLTTFRTGREALQFVATVLAGRAS